MSPNWMIEDDPCFYHCNALIADARRVVKWSMPMSTAPIPWRHLGQATVYKTLSFLWEIAWLRLIHPHNGLDWVMRALTE